MVVLGMQLVQAGFKVSCTPSALVNWRPFFALWVFEDVGTDYYYAFWL